MESFIQEFKGERDKNSDILISICGPSGAGKGTLANFIAEKLDINCYSAGDFFRQLASDKGLTVEELSAQADKQTDIEVDERTLEKGLSEDCVIESRISAWVLGDYADFSIYVTADLDERARRVNQNIEEREAEDADTHENVKKRIKKRDEDNSQRYREYYGIDMEEREIFDLIIDNTEMSIKEQEELVEKALKKQFPNRIE